MILNYCNIRSYNPINDRHYYLNLNSGEKIKLIPGKMQGINKILKELITNKTELISPKEKDHAVYLKRM